MTPTPEQAQATLDDIDRLVAGTRRAIVAAHAADHLVVWGIVWMLGFGAMAVTAWHPGWVWLGLVSLGSLSSVAIGFRAQRIVEGTHGARILWCFLLLGLFAGIWAIVLHPFNGRHFGAYLGTVFMFAYVAGGLWFGRFFVLLGSAITVMALAAVLFAPEWVDILMALAGGGSLLAAGLYMRSAWT